MHEAVHSLTGFGRAVPQNARSGHTGAARYPAQCSASTAR